MSTHITPPGFFTSNWFDFEPLLSFLDESGEIMNVVGVQSRGYYTEWVPLQL